MARKSKEVRALEKKVADLEKKLEQASPITKKVYAAVDTINAFMQKKPKGIGVWIDWDSKQLVLVEYDGPKRTVIYPVQQQGE